MGLCLLGSAVSGQNDCAAPYCPSMLALARAGSPLPLFFKPACTQESAGALEFDAFPPVCLLLSDQLRVEGYVNNLS